MDFDLATWLAALTERLQQAFGARIHFLGLQGSYQRGEATPTSDVDVVLVLDALSLADLRAYRRILEGLEQREKACGFVCGRQELAAWSALDLFHLLADTRPLVGDLTSLVPAPGDADIREAIRLAAGNLYHAACHRHLHCDDLQVGVERLAGDYKAARYALQQLVYLETGRYYPTRAELASQLRGLDREVLEVGSRWKVLRADRQARPERYFQLLIDWSAQVLRRLAPPG